MAINRRNFVQLALLSSGMLFASSPEIKALHKIMEQKGLSFNSEDWVSLMQSGRKALRKRDFDLADSSYRQAITLAPDKIQGYDGLKKVLMSQNRLLEATELCRIGWKKNPDKAAFVDRFSSALRRLVMGHGKQTVAFINKYGEGQLLEQAAKLYIHVLEDAPDKTYLKIGLREVQKSIEVARGNAERMGNKFTFDSTIAAQMKSAISSLSTKNKKKEDLTALSDTELQNRIDYLSHDRTFLEFEDARESRDLGIKKSAKRLYQAQAAKKLRNKDWEGALEVAVLIAQIYPTDSTNYKLRKRLNLKMKNFPGLVEIAREKNALNQGLFGI